MGVHCRSIHSTTMAVLRFAVALALASSAAAFTPSPMGSMMTTASSVRSAPVRMGVESMEGVGPETGGKIFDPLGFSKIASDETLAWYRAAELKHGRVAMAATVGYALTASGVRFPGNLATGVPFDSLKTATAWDNMPDAGKWQILGVIGIMELLGEAQKPHYTQGGTLSSSQLSCLRSRRLRRGSLSSRTAAWR